MIKPLKGLLFFTLAIFVVSSWVLSADLSLTKIGSLDTGGKVYSEWWYTGTNPVFQGNAVANSTVTVKIDENTYTASANESGLWSYSTSLASGDHAVEISEGQSKYSFTLHIGQDVPAGAGSADTQESTSAVPSTGFNQFTGLTMGIGVVLLASYMYMMGDHNRKPIFAKRIIED